MRVEPIQKIDGQVGTASVEKWLLNDNVTF